MRKPLQQIQQTVLSWTVAWAAIGMAFGIAQLLRTGQVSWIARLGLGAAAAGLGVGLTYACLMLATEPWRDSFAETPGFAAQMGPQLLCGAGAGLIPGLLVGGITGAIFFGVLGVCSAAAFNWKGARESLSSRSPRSKLSSAKGAKAPGRR